MARQTLFPRDRRTTNRRPQRTAAQQVPAQMCLRRAGRVKRMARSRWRAKPNKGQGHAGCLPIRAWVRSRPWRARCFWETRLASLPPTGGQLHRDDPVRAQQRQEAATGEADQRRQCTAPLPMGGSDAACRDQGRRTKTLLSAQAHPESLQFLAAAEIIECDLWLQYQELGGVLPCRADFSRPPSV